MNRPGSRMTARWWLLGLALLAQGIAAAGAETLRDAAALHAAALEEAARPVPPRLSRAMLLALPQRRAPTLSPDGRRLAWLAERGGRRTVWLQDLPGGAPRALLPRTDAGELAWTRDGRWLVLPDARRLVLLPVDGPEGARTLGALGGLSRREFLRPDPVQPAAVLVLERPPQRGIDEEARWRLLRIAADGTETLLHEDRRPIVDAAIGADGALAWLQLAEGEAHVFQRLADPAPRVPALRCADFRRCRLVGSAPAGGAWLVGNPEGDLAGLWRLHADGRLERRHEDPRGEADLAELTLDAAGQPRLIGYRSTVARLWALEAADAPRLAALQRRFPGRALRVEIGGDTWRVEESGDTLRGERQWIADGEGGLVEMAADAGFVFAGKPQARPDEALLARKRPVRWRASDGRLLHGFLSLPPGRDAARAPLVVSVHGGPFSLVRPDFSNDAQLLANRGYAVFQPNFRGSTGLGRDYLFAAGGDFGNGRVQRDIVDGTRWLLAQGIGDPERVGIVGASFGGYSALLGATFEPSLFKTAVAGVPPVDFGWVMREYLGAGHEMFPGIPMAASMRQLGLDPADATLHRRLAEQSPAANAAALQRPVLVLAGGEDERVPIRGVTHYAARLRVLGKDVSLFVDGAADHGIADPRSREAYWFLMETLLHRELGGDPPEPADEDLRAHLEAHLRLRGAALAPL